MKKKLTKEEKELLIKDLLPRIPTDLLVKVPGEKEPKELRKRVRWMIVYGKAKSIEDCLEGLIPYLRPESSMTKKDEEDYYKYNEDSNLAKAHDWYCTHHFDIRGLIPLGLAIEAEEGMYEKQ